MFRHEEAFKRISFNPQLLFQNVKVISKHFLTSWPSQKFEAFCRILKEIKPFIRSCVFLIAVSWSDLYDFEDQK